MSLRDLLGPAKTEQVLDQIHVFAEQAKTLGLKELQPWDEFFTGFKPPKSWTREDVEKRVVTNFLQYRTNYVLACMGVVVLSLVTSPALILVLLLCAGLWFYVMVVKAGSIVIGDSEYDETKKAIACGGATLMLLVLFGQLLKLLGIFALCAILVGLHLLFRQRNMKSKFNRLAEETKLGVSALYGADLEGGEDPSEGVSTNVNPGYSSTAHRRHQ